MKELKEQCRHFDTCKAPLCPKDKSSIKYGIWYPDEDICVSSEYSKLRYIETQRKIKKHSRSDDAYFTIQMLDRDFIVGRAIKGLDPDKNIDETAALNKWLKKHPELKKRQLNQRSLDALKKVNCNRSTG